RTWTDSTCKPISPGNAQRFLSSSLPATISRRPASAPWRAAHQLSFANQCTIALSLMPFPPLPPALPDETNQSVRDPFNPSDSPPLRHTLFPPRTSPRSPLTPPLHQTS